MLLRNKRGGWFEVPDEEYMKYKNIKDNKRQADIRNNLKPVNIIENGRKIIFANSGEDEDYDDDNEIPATTRKHLSLAEHEKVGELRKKLKQLERELSNTEFAISNYTKDPDTLKQYEKNKEDWQKQIEQIKQEIEKIEKG